MADNYTKEELIKQINLLSQENIALKQAQFNMQEEKEIAQNISERRTRLMQLLNIVIYVTDLKSLPIHLRGAVEEITSYTGETFLKGNIHWEKLIHPEDLAIFQDKTQKLLEEGDHYQEVEYRIITGEGQIIWVNDVSFLIRDQTGQPLFIEGMITDITKHKRIEDDFLEHQAHLNSILSSVQDVIWSVTPDTFELLYINPTAEEVYGHTIETIYQMAASNDPKLNVNFELLLDNFSTLLQKGSFETEFKITHTNGEERWLHRRAYFARDAQGGLTRIDGIDTDITRRKQAEDLLRFISLHDGLTNLYNRFSFENEMQRMDASEFNSAALIVFDVDGLKLINDNLGHKAGDQLLLICAELLRNSFPDPAIISRIGGDEFTVLIENKTMPELEDIVAKFRQNLIEFNQSNPPLPVSVSLGYAIRGLQAKTMSDVFKQADNMLYEEKANNRTKFRTMWEARITDFLPNN
ncbi:MAG TPA: diguanylate cyclase [Syntrophomonadaceae bacterium]|nr:diguanylate cyclase [Syntrophomonadaceae bacterium]